MVGHIRRRRLVLAALGLVLVFPMLPFLAGDTIAVGAPSGASPLVYVAASGTGRVDAFTLSAIAGGGPLAATQSDDLSGDGTPSGMAITRNSSSAVVVANEDGSEDTTVIDTSSGAAQAPFAALPGTDGTLEAVSADPADGRLVYALTAYGDLFQVNIATQAVSEVADLATTLVTEKSPFDLVRARSLAVGADGATAYVGAFGVLNDLDGEAVLQVSLETPNPPVTAWAQKSPASAERIGVISLALTPSGAEIFGCDHGEIFGLQLPISPAEVPFDTVVMVGVDSVTVGPHGKNVYAGVVNANDQAAVVGFGVTAPNAVTVDSLQTVPSLPLADSVRGVQLAAVARGGTLIATVTLDSDTGSEAPFIFDVALGNLTATGSPVMVLGPAVALPTNLQYPVAVAITPDQAPRASFTGSIGPAGSPSNFSAAASTVKYGSITSYKWSFGDGSPVLTTSSDAATHVFASAGTYKVTLVERDSAGTTIPPAFPGTPPSWVADGPGQTPYRFSSMKAETSQEVTVNQKKHVLPTTTTSTVTTSTTSTTSTSTTSTSTTTTTTSTTTTTTTTTLPRKRAPSLLLEPTVGPPGSVVTVKGTHFPNNATVTVEWSTPNASSTAVKAKARNGGFVVQLIVLVPDLLGPRRAIAVSFTKANRPKFLVVAGAEEPGGSNALPVFRSEGP